MGPEQAVHAGSQQAVDLPWLLRIPPQADDAEAVEQRHEAGTPVALVEAHGVDARSSQVGGPPLGTDRKSTRLNSSHALNSYAVLCLKKKH